MRSCCAWRVPRCTGPQISVSVWRPPVGSKESDLDSWFSEWQKVAAATAALAEQEEAAGHLETARLAYLRASSYYRTAGVILMGIPLDPRLVASNLRQTETFRAAAALMQPAAEIVEITFEGSSLPGYFFRAAADDRPRATVLLTGG